MANEASGILEGEMQGVARAFYYGRGALGHAKAFPGLIDAYDATNMVVDAGGSTAGTGSSVWAVKFGEKNVIWVWGKDGRLVLNPVRVETILDPNDSTKKLDGYVQTMQAYPGLQVGSKQCIARIKKLTADSGCGLTDARLSDLLALFPTRIKPDVIFCSRRSLSQLRKSRTATNETGKEAPLPQDYDGIPLVPTDSIADTEALTL
jgi:hypothetical protein